MAVVLTLRLARSLAAPLLFSVRKITFFKEHEDEDEED